MAKREAGEGPAEAAGAIGLVSLNRRYFSLDVLRGAAVLGILPVNIVLFATIMAASGNPTAYGDFSGTEVWLWRAVHVLAEQKFLTLFSILFGASLVLMTERVERKGGNAWEHYRRRMLWLLVFGMVHAYLFWFGDILVGYALCGLVAFWFRKTKISQLWLLGGLLLAVPSLFNVAFQLSIGFLPEEMLSTFQNEWEPGPEAIASELAAYQGGWLSQLKFRVVQAFGMQVGGFMVYTFWRVLGLMLFGIALQRTGILIGRNHSRRLYLDMFLFGVGLGLPLVAFGAEQNLQLGFFYKQSMFNGMQWNYWGSIGMAIGYIGLLILISRIRYFVMVTGALATVGRMALTNYLLQTLICSILFYYLGYFGQWGREKMMLAVLAIWAFQVLGSMFWLRHFEQGPMERLWRKLTYRS